MGVNFQNTSDSDGIRHGGIDFTNAPAEDAKYMLVSCSACINYLIENQSKIKNKKINKKNKKKKKTKK